MSHSILNINEKEIIRTLFREKIPITIHDISTISGISWVTVNKYLNILFKKSIISKVQVNNKPKFTLNQDLLLNLYNYQKRERSVINENF